MIWCTRFYSPWCTMREGGALKKKNPKEKKREGERGRSHFNSLLSREAVSVSCGGPGRRRRARGGAWRSRKGPEVGESLKFSVPHTKFKILLPIISRVLEDGPRFHMRARTSEVRCETVGTLPGRPMVRGVAVRRSGRWRGGLTRAAAGRHRTVRPASHRRGHLERPAVTLDLHRRAEHQGGDGAP